MISTLRTVVLIFVFSIIPNSIAATDIFISQVSKTGEKISFSKAKNVTKRPGYDNQPYFSNDGKMLYFTSQLGEQTDLMSLDLASFKQTNLTATEETSEYSPTLFNNEKNISFVKVEKDGTQRLWQIVNGQKEQSLLNTSIKPVGYHIWGPDQDLALFVLGEPMVLQYVSSTTRAKGDIVAREIGRTLRYNRTLNAFTFTKTKKNILTTYSPSSEKQQEIVALLGETEDYAWLDEDTIIVANKNKIYGFSIHSDTKSWQMLVDFSEQCETRITRLAVDNNSRTLAFVCDENKD